MVYVTIVSNPDPPSTLQEEGEIWWIWYNVFVPPQTFGSTIWLANVAIISPVPASLPQTHLALLITLILTYLARLQFAEAQQATSKP